MPLQYPLLFPYGEDGWSPPLKLLNETGSNARNLTVNMYYSYQIHAQNGVQSLILNSSSLFQQYLVDAYISIVQGRLDFYQNNQDKLRSAYISGIYDALSNSDTESLSVGKRVLLPPSFLRGPRYMYSHYQDALCICREHGNPQYFCWNKPCNFQINMKEKQKLFSVVAVHEQKRRRGNRKLISIQKAGHTNPKIKGL